MTEQHPITPPPELVQQWVANATGPDYEQVIATQAAQWGADQELKACYEWVVRDWTDIQSADMLLAARRPKPPSLKEQALAEIQEIEGAMYGAGLGCDFTATRRALEQLDD